MNRGIVEWNEEYRELIEKKYTFIVCVANVFRDHHWEDKSFLKEQFKELLGPPPGMHIATLQGHTAVVRCLTAVGNKLYSGSVDSTIRVWDTDTHQHITTLQGHTNSVTCLTAVGNKLYSVSVDKTIRVWDTDTHKHITTLRGHTKEVACLTMVGGKLYSGSCDKTIRVWTL